MRPPGSATGYPFEPGLKTGSKRYGHLDALCVSFVKVSRGFREFCRILEIFDVFLNGFLRYLQVFRVFSKGFGELLRFVTIFGETAKRTVCGLRRALFAFSRTLEVVRVFDNFRTF